MKIENSSYFMASQVKKKETVKIKQSMTRTTGNFRALTLRGKSAGQEEDVSGKMRQRSVLFLLDMLFGEHARRLPSFGESGLSSSWGFENLHYETETYYMQEQSASFQTQGQVVTADGRTIDFNLNVHMSSRFEAYYKESFDIQKAVNLCDPLVINLDSSPATVSDQTFYFDLDGDGVEEDIHKLNSGSGYLALDKNNDGKINDGNELFGTASGDGFADLAKYDEDGNGWIDENDAIWNHLKIWVQTEQGPQLYSLADKGVGAICLNRMPTYYTQYDKDGEVSAVVRSTGMFLYENGAAGSMQHLDLAT
ncbi:MAG: hypothetical protein HFI11_03885 [Lachnospiraceae bacterium]|mgnify:CR=1 FL=1|nr:hypothetical protein [Lachnospiraceae bacterium]